MAQSPPLPAPPQQPASFDVTPEQLLKQTQAMLDATRTLHDSLVAALSPQTATFETLVRPMLADDDACGGRLARFRLLSSVSEDPALREASRAAEQLVHQADAASLMRSDVAELVAAVHARETTGESSLDEEDAYSLLKVHRAYQNAGAGIKEETARKLYLDTVQELNAVVVAAKKQLNDSDEGVWFSQDELDGVPRALLERMQHEEQRRDGEDGETSTRYRVTFVPGQYMAVMKNARNAQTRKTLQAARENRFPENLGRLRKAIALRDEVARMLGFANHAEKKIESRMAESVDAVMQRLGELTERLRPVANQEKDVLLELKRQYGLGDTQDPADAERLNVWDLQFYKRMLEEERFSVDSALVSEYFEVNQSLRGMLGIFENLFGMRFGAIEAPTWQKHVMVYTAWDAEEEGGGFLGYLYLDLFMRPGKYKGARCSLIEPGYDTPSGRNYPSTALICSFARSSGKPTLLLHSEIKTMFHELGHAIHKLVTRTKNHNTCARDFVEIPSVMLENWIWVPDVIVRLGKHYSYLSDEYASYWREQVGASADAERPSETMPVELARDLARTKNMLGALNMLPSVHLATFDMRIHSPGSSDEARNMDTTDIYETLRKDIVGWERRGGIPDASFAHMFRGYDAAYFTYCLSRVYATDLWSSCFEKDPMNKLMGMRYRRAVLQPGGGRPEMHSLQEFLGRKPGVDAFFREVMRSSFTTASPEGQL